MYPPGDESDAARRAGGASDGAIYFLWATMLANGTIRLVAKDDVPFGIAQIATVLAGVAWRLLRKRRIATWVIDVALAT
jgi:hypothetical protein